MKQIDSYLSEDHGVLKNKLGITNPHILETITDMLTTSRADEWAHMDSKHKPKELNFDYMKTLHKHLFQDVFEWAGQVRTIPIAKGDSIFAMPGFIEPEANKIFGRLKDQQFFQFMDDKQQVAEHMAHFYSELNAVHPFREGNGRVMNMISNELAKQAGFEMAWHEIPGAAFNQAASHAHSKNLGQLPAMFHSILTPANEKQQTQGQEAFISHNNQRMRLVTPDKGQLEIKGVVADQFQQEGKHYLVIKSHGKQLAVEDRTPQHEQAAKQPGRLIHLVAERRSPHFVPQIEKPKERSKEVAIGEG